MTPSPPILTVSNLSKQYGPLLAVKKIDFTVGEGEIFALIGPNGAGKSTTLKIIATILRPTSGEVTLADQDLLTHPDAVRPLLSYLPEEAGAYKNLSGLAYLKMMAALYTADRHTQKHVVEFGQELAGLGDRLRDKVGSYSKGMTRKLLLARTVMTRPRLAILDEPTSGLDVVNAWEIRGIIRRLAGEGMAVLLSSHNMLEIEYLSDRVAILHQGIIQAEGTAADLKKQHRAQNLEEVFIAISQPGKRPVTTTTILSKPAT
jgi:ABC-2 type transport system ATP-binding protein